MPQSQDTYVALPDGRYVQVPRNATPDQLTQLRTKLASFAKASGMDNAQPATPTAPAAPEEKKPSFFEKLTAPDDPNAKNPATKFLSDAGGALIGGTIGAPGAVYHAIADEPTEEEAKDFEGHTRIPGELAFERLTSEPIVKGLQKWKGLHPTVKDILEALPGALGQGVGGVAAGEIGGKVAEATEAGRARLMQAFSDPKLTQIQGSRMIADFISKEDLSPRQFGKQLQESFDQISRKAGAEKGEFVARVAREHPDLTVNHTNVQKVLQQQVDNLNTLKKDNPPLFAQGEGLDKTLKILTAELESTNGKMAGIKSGLRKGNLPEADLRRSQYWNFHEQLDRSMAKKIVGDLDKASTQDILEALTGKDPKMGRDYLAASHRYHELQNLGRMETLKSVFGDARVAPGKVIEVLNQAPEDSLAAVRVLNKENPAVIDSLRRQLFEQSSKTAGARGVFKQQPALLREIYGPGLSDAVSQFVDIINTKAAKGGSLFSKIPGKGGDIFRILEARGRPGVTIRASEMAKILKSAQMVRLFTEAAEMPADAGPAQFMRESLARAMHAADIQPEETAKPSRTPVWKQNTPPPSDPNSAAEGWFRTHN